MLHVGLYLLGFKARACLQPWHTWRQSTFVYPDERAMPGSTTAFIALHEAMLQTDRCVQVLAHTCMHGEACGVFTCHHASGSVSAWAPLLFLVS